MGVVLRWMASNNITSWLAQATRRDVEKKVKQLKQKDAHRADKRKTRKTKEKANKQELTRLTNKRSGLQQHDHQCCAWLDNGDGLQAWAQVRHLVTRQLQHGVVDCLVEVISPNLLGKADALQHITDGALDTGKVHLNLVSLGTLDSTRQQNGECVRD